jgi:hypothetical protein
LDEGPDFMLAYDKDGKPLLPEKVLKDFSGEYHEDVLFAKC